MKQKYQLKIIKGKFKGDRWDEFFSIKEIDKFISETRIHCSAMFKKGTMEIQELKNNRYRGLYWR